MALARDSESAYGGSTFFRASTDIAAGVQGSSGVNGSLYIQSACDMARDQVECSKVQRRARVIVVDADYSYLRLVKDALKRSGVSIEVEFEGGEDRVVSVDETCEIRVRESLLVNGGRPIPLASGELNLLLYLSTPRGVWRQTRELAAVLGRADEAGRTLVWQYMSRVKSKLGSAAAALEHARNRGYRIRPALRD